MGKQIVGFNYDKIDTAKRQVVQQHATEINGLLRRTAENIVAIGQHLLDVKEALPDGLFTGWMYAEFRWGKSSAACYMRIAREFGHLDCLDKFQPSALDFLARKPMSDLAIEKAVTASRAGEVISQKKAYQLVHKYPPQRNTPTPDTRPAICYDVVRRLAGFVDKRTAVMKADELRAFGDALDNQATRVRKLAEKGEAGPNGRPAENNGQPPVNDKHTLTLGTDAEGEVTLDLLKLLESRALIQGNSGAGKSWFLRLLAEQAAERVPTIILDTEGDFATLKDAVDVVLVGPTGELPVDPETADDLAVKLADLRVSAVVDISELDQQSKRDFVAGFCRALVDLPKELWKSRLVMVDEAHLYCPQGSNSGCSESRKAIIDLILTLGRKRGLCGVLATQRLSKLHKDAAAECTNVFIGRTWLPLDQQRAGEMLGLGASERQQLRDLEPGQFYAVGPALLRSGVVLLGSGAVKSSHGKPKEVPAPPQGSEVLQAQSPSVPAGSLLQFPAGGAA